MSKAMHSLRAAIFDMDGTLFDTEHLRIELFKQASKECVGFELSDEYLLACLGLNEHNAALLAVEFYGVDIDFSKIRQQVHVLEQQYIVQHGLPLKAGVHELLAQLKARHIKMAIATSNRRSLVEEYLRQSGLAHYFDAVVCGDEVAQGKPHPEIFCTAAQRLNIPTQHCLMIEDSENGLYSAYQAGGITVLIPDVKAPTEQMYQQADYVYCNAQDLLTDLNSSI